MYQDDLLMDWDRDTDIINVLREGYDPEKLINVDSVKVPGIVKRMDPESGQCVGFIIHGFSQLLPGQSNLEEWHVKELLSISLNLTNEAAGLQKAG